MAHRESLRPSRERLGALFSELLSVGILPGAVLRKLLGNISCIGGARGIGAQPLDSGSP